MSSGCGKLSRVDEYDRRGQLYLKIKISELVELLLDCDLKHYDYMLKVTLPDLTNQSVLDISD